MPADHHALVAVLVAVSVAGDSAGADAAGAEADAAGDALPAPASAAGAARALKVPMNDTMAADVCALCSSALIVAAGSSLGNPCAKLPLP